MEPLNPEPINPQSHAHVRWCQELWDRISDGGVWAVPRSGLVFRKDEAAKRLTLVERMPYSEEMPGTAEDLRLYQDSDIEAIRKRFALVGVECSLMPQ
jgi:hypothetical protein